MRDKFRILIKTGFPAIRRHRTATDQGCSCGATLEQTESAQQAAAD